VVESCVCAVTRRSSEKAEDTASVSDKKSGFEVEVMRKRNVQHHGTILPLHNAAGGSPVPGHATPMRRKRKKKKQSNYSCFGTFILFCGSFIFIFAAVFGILHHNSPEIQAHVKRHVDKIRDKAHRVRKEYKKGKGIPFKPEEAGKRLNQKMPRPHEHASQAMTCPDGTRGLVNDNYCDCADGSDEPDTSACSMRLVQRETFKCKDGSRTLYSSRVGDGIKDCDDGSDEPKRRFSFSNAVKKRK
jgi:hypothetical protein